MRFINRISSVICSTEPDIKFITICPWRCRIYKHWLFTVCRRKQNTTCDIFLNINWTNFECMIINYKQICSIPPEQLIDIIILKDARTTCHVCQHLFSKAFAKYELIRQDFGILPSSTITLQLRWWLVVFRWNFGI